MPQSDGGGEGKAGGRLVPKLAIRVIDANHGCLFVELVVVAVVVVVVAAWSRLLNVKKATYFPP